ncbi:hypothetical protein CASFOL_026046 [Castilleja foliolosa]|uniref:Uncharacterized protein n=1 Tax=Castilleja foliolosa TaxID=1961234 RepID=A0ABD3CWV1_9LAMI
MALASSCSSRVVCNTPNPYLTSLRRRPHRTSLNFTVSATPKKLSRSGKFDSKNRRGNPGTTTTKDEEETTVAEEVFVDDGFVVPELPGDKPDFWEGPQFDGLGFFVQYMWAFGIVFALVACGIAVATYNEGATDFKETPVYKDAIQSRELLEEPDASTSDVFESNPTEQAPSLD